MFFITTSKGEQIWIRQISWYNWINTACNIYWKYQIYFSTADIFTFFYWLYNIRNL